MPRPSPQHVAALLQNIHLEWEKHTNRHKVGQGWGTFRSLVSVLQVAAGLLLAFGVILQVPGVLSAFAPEHWIHRFVPTPFELLMLLIATGPEWLEVYFFGRADSVLRSSGVVKRISIDAPIQRHSSTSLRGVWYGQVLSRLANIAVHVVFAVALSAMIFYAVRGNFGNTPGLAAPLQ